MPDRDFNRSDGGWFAVMNEFADAMCWYRLRTAEWQVVWHIIRRTWGIKGRAWAAIGYVDFMKKCQISNSSVSRSLRSLMKRNFVHRKMMEGKYHYKINSKPSTWKTAEPDEYRRKTTPELEHKGDTPELEHNILQNWSQNTPELQLNRNYTFKRKDNIKRQGKDTPIVPKKKSGPKSDVLTKKQIIEHDAKTVVDYINAISGKNFQHSETSLGPIRGRLKEGFTLEQCLQVCQNKWWDPDHKEKYYRPTTLFRPSLFEGYVNEKGTKRKPTNSRQDARLQKWYRRYQNYGKETENPNATD